MSLSSNKRKINIEVLPDINDLSIVINTPFFLELLQNNNTIPLNSESALYIDNLYIMHIIIYR